MSEDGRQNPAKKLKQDRERVKMIKRSSRNEFLLKPSAAFRSAKSYTRKKKHPANCRDDD